MKDGSAEGDAPAGQVTNQATADKGTIDVEAKQKS